MSTFSGEDQYRHHDKLKLSRCIFSTFVEVFLITIILPLCISRIDWYLNTAEREKNDLLTNKLINAVAGNKSNSQNLIDLASYQYQEIFQASEKESKIWAKDFVKKLPQHKSTMNQLNETSKTMAENLSLKWNPLYTYILNELDIRTEIFKQSELIEESEEKIVNLILVDSHFRNDKLTRRIKFTNGNELKLIVSSGNIDRGKLTTSPRLFFHAKFFNGVTDAVISIDFRNNSFEIGSSNSRYNDLITSYETNLDPIKDSKFLSAITESINRLFNYMLLK